MKKIQSKVSIVNMHKYRENLPVTLWLKKIIIIIKKWKTIDYEQITFSLVLYYQSRYLC